MLNKILFIMVMFISNVITASSSDVHVPIDDGDSDPSIDMVRSNATGVDEKYSLTDLDHDMRRLSNDNLLKQADKDDPLEQSRDLDQAGNVFEFSKRNNGNNSARLIHHDAINESPRSFNSNDSNHSKQNGDDTGNLPENNQDDHKDKKNDETANVPKSKFFSCSCC
jgi:hypothetical protein